jgi:glutathione S-transferase
MEPVLFYGIPEGCSFGSIVALEWLGQPYRLCRINMPEDMQGDVFRQINPVRKTPALLLADGRTLTESFAILHNIAARNLEKQLTFAPGTPQYDRVNQVLAFLTSDFFSSFAPAFKAFDIDLTGEKDPAMQEMLRQLGRREIAKAHAGLEEMLGDREWLAGDTRTIADAYFIGIARWAPFLASTGAKTVDQRDYPRLHRLTQKLEADPAVVFAHAIEDQKPAVSAGGFRGHVSLDDLRPRLAA